MMKTDILIVTALKLEFDAVKEFLSNISYVTHPTSASQYCIGKFSEITIALIEAGAGNVKAAHETDRAILFFDPTYIFFVGIAGGIKDVSILDLVVSTKVVGYEIGKESEEFKPRYDSVPASYKLEQLAKKVVRKSTELSFKIFIAPIAAGEKVIATTKTKIYEHLIKYCSDAIAVEMEGYGFLEATRPYDVEAIVIRGISDLLNNKSQSDAEGSQEIAASRAAKFTFLVINALIEENKPDLSNSETKNLLISKLIELYPAGPESEDIWKRAGGDTSILVNEKSRRSQWFNVIEKLSKGGGGKNISLQSLITAIKSDYPNFNI